MKNQQKGSSGEERIKAHYEKNRFECLEQNYRYRRSEVDLILLSFEENLIVFVEVKVRSSSMYGEPESFVSDSQQARIKEAAEEYIYGINWNKDIRFDIACINAAGEVEIFEDAF